MKGIECRGRERTVMSDLGLEDLHLVLQLLCPCHFLGKTYILKSLCFGVNNIPPPSLSSPALFIPLLHVCVCVCVCVYVCVCARILMCAWADYSL
jgi:hypothetical protein